MQEILRISISFSGNDADKHEIDLYDVSQALIGFQRSLALTTHLVLNDQIITQAPSLKNARILAIPSEEGSWKLTAVLAISTSALLTAGTAPQNSVIGNLVYSAYDYVVNETLGFHVDYNKSLGQLYEELQITKSKLPNLEQYRFDSLVEKCEKPIKDMHRPIYAKQTATEGNIYIEQPSRNIPIGQPINLNTFEYVSYTITDNEISTIKGRVSSYNSNTFKGRIYVSEEGRPLPFTLNGEAKSEYCASVIANSLVANTQRTTFTDDGYVFCKVLKNKSKSGMLKSYIVVNVSPTSFE